MEDSIIASKTKDFAVKIIELNGWLRSNRVDYALTSQILRSGTSVGANVREARRGQSRADFYAKMNVALKEADETAYWLELLKESGMIGKDRYEALYADCEEIIRILTSITKKQREER